MKRFAAVISLCTIILTLTACTGTGVTSKPENSGDTNKPPSTTTGTTQATPSKTDTAAVAQTAQKPVAGLGKSSGVVAKSNNVISSQDNGAVMTELDKELDSLFSSIDKLEDVDDNDLN